MRILTKILIIVAVIVSIRILIIADISDRNIYYSIHTPKEEFETFQFKPIDEKIKAYKENFGNPKWKFPREKVEKVILYENKLFISRLTSIKLEEYEINKVIEILNDPNNFDWSETTWSLKEAEYILRFFNSENKKIGEIWLCLNDCGMTKSLPFSPNMKFGGLNEQGKKRIMEILKIIKKST
jgi:hypothetical protein